MSFTVSPCFGIISYFPDDPNARSKRILRFERLIGQLSELWPEVPILLIAQQWGKYSIGGKCLNKVIRYNFPRLGIKVARSTLREKFLESSYNYIIMFDDDAIIEVDNDHAAKDYMNKLSENPQGFCFIKGVGSSFVTPYADSQLNLCAISKYIYEKEPIPEVDPQKSEAYEDRIWSTLLHYKYADLEFDPPDGIKHVHFKNADIEAYGGDVPSTWAKEKRHDWSSLGENTRKIEKYIAINKELPSRDFGIDLVVPYVDSTDPEWLNIFNQYNPADSSIEAVNAANRFRGQGTFFKYWFRCVEKNMPWIKRIILIVQSESQVPVWLDKSKVRVVLHSDFIPPEYLPTYNSTCIEMFLWNIPNLREHFIYVNDDMFVVNPVESEQFFEKGKIKNDLIDLKWEGQMYHYHCLRSLCLVYGRNFAAMIHKQNFTFKSFGHTFRPYLRSVMEKAFKEHESLILDSISRFRENKNLNIYYFAYYLNANGYRVGSGGIKSSFVAAPIRKRHIDWVFNEYKPHVIAFQDIAPEIDIYQSLDIRRHLNKKYHFKSKYEI